MVYRLVTANTIDEKIVERAAAKRKLEKMIIHSKKFKSQDMDGLKKTMEAITPQELLELLNSKDHLGVVDRKDGPGQRANSNIIWGQRLASELKASDIKPLTQQVA
jgi:ATP-dependent DNA helicase